MVQAVDVSEGVEFRVTVNAADGEPDIGDLSAVIQSVALDFGGRGADGT